MRDLLSTFSLPWYIWVMFGLIIGSILVSSSIREEFICMVAHGLGLHKKDEGNDDR